MDETTPRLRSPELMSADDTALLVVDVQARLVPLIARHERLVWNVRRLLDAAAVLGIPAAATEQYPAGLGPTVEPLAGRLPPPPSKLTFSCLGCPELLDAWTQAGRDKLLVAGIEAHVCVQQTVLDLLASGFRVYVAADAVGSRFDEDRQFALRRMEACGATLTTCEAAMFEWCEVAGTDKFKRISALVRETPPAEHA